MIILLLTTISFAQIHVWELLADQRSEFPSNTSRPMSSRNSQTNLEKSGWDSSTIVPMVFKMILCLETSQLQCQELFTDLAIVSGHITPYYENLHFLLDTMEHSSCLNNTNEQELSLLNICLSLWAFYTCIYNLFLSNPPLVTILMLFST